MTHLIYLFSFVFILLLNSCTSPKADTTHSDLVSTKVSFHSGTYTVDSDISTLGWIGKKLTGQHAGNVRIQEGSVRMDSTGILTDGHFVIDMQTITCSDISDPEKNQDLVGHLKDGDFFDVAAFPIATFRVTGSEPDENGKTQISGMLTIKDKTNPVTFPAQISQADSALSISAAFTIDRTRWGVVYNSLKTLGDQVKDRAIEDDIRFTLHLVARKKPI